MPWIALLLVSFLYTIFLTLCVVQIRWNYFIKAYNKGYKKGQIALTFDDGPNSETAMILDILKEENVPAAFFCIGKNVIANPLLILRMHDEGHIIGNHSQYHTHSFDWMSANRMLAEIEECNDSVQQVTGFRPNLFRPPYGVTNPNLARAVRRSGMKTIGWSLRSYDTVIRQPEKLKARILGKLKDGDIILLHDSVPATREILTDLIHEARKKGFTFVRIDQLLDVSAYA